MRSKEKAIFTALCRRSLPEMSAYQTDLVIHDKNFIMHTRAALPFIHVTRRNGTDMFAMYSIARYPFQPVPFLFFRATGREILESMYNGLLYSLKNAEIVQYYDGVDLYTISTDKAKKLFADHRYSILNTQYKLLTNSRPFRAYKTFA